MQYFSVFPEDLLAFFWGYQMIVFIQIGAINSAPSQCVSLGNFRTRYFPVSPQIKLSARRLCIRTVGCVGKMATPTCCMQQLEIHVCDLACDATFCSALADSSVAGSDVLMILALCVMSLSTVVRQSHRRAGNIWHASRMPDRRPHVRA